MDYNGKENTVLTYEKTVSNGDVDATTCAYSDYNSDVKITNQLEFADINSYGFDVTYLSRSDWDATWTGALTGLTATNQMISDFANGATASDSVVGDEIASVKNGVDYNSKATNHKIDIFLSPSIISNLVRIKIVFSVLDNQKRQDDILCLTFGKTPQIIPLPVFHNFFLTEILQLSEPYIKTLNRYLQILEKSFCSYIPEIVKVYPSHSI